MTERLVQPLLAMMHAFHSYNLLCWVMSWRAMPGNKVTVYLRYNLQLTLYSLEGFTICAAPKIFDQFLSTPPTIDRAGIQIINVVGMADVGPAKLVGACLNKPHTSVTALRTRVSVYIYL